MIRFEVVLSEDADNDINEYVNFIIYEYKVPLTALRNYQRLFDTIFSLEKIADKIPINQSKYLQQFGFNVRRINYKKWQLSTLFITILHL